VTYFFIKAFWLVWIGGSVAMWLKCLSSLVFNDTPDRFRIAGVGALVAFVWPLAMFSVGGRRIVGGVFSSK